MFKKRAYMYIFQTMNFIEVQVSRSKKKCSNNATTSFLADHVCYFETKYSAKLYSRLTPRLRVKMSFTILN